MKKNWKEQLIQFGSYVLVAALASVLTLVFVVPSQVRSRSGKAAEVKQTILEQYIGDVDAGYLDDMAAAAMVAATGDKWSYYVPADQLQAVQDSAANAYVGIGITVVPQEDGYLVKYVEPESPAYTEDIRTGDVIIAVDDKAAAAVGLEAMLEGISGVEGTSVTVQLLRDGQTLTKTLVRKRVFREVVSGQMLTDAVGYIRIDNFNERSAQETIAVFERLEKEGARAMVFDVRCNPGGYVSEMVTVLDYLLPEGVLFRMEDYTGDSQEEYSTADCKQMPMAVLMNEESYSGAEFFAAALWEYDYAVTVGHATTGKGRFQQLIVLSDNSAINLSVGRYYTPKGVNLGDVGGIAPDIPVEMDEDTMLRFSYRELPVEEDLQLQAALAAVEKQLQ